MYNHLLSFLLCVLLVSAISWISYLCGVKDGVARGFLEGQKAELEYSILWHKEYIKGRSLEELKAQLKTLEEQEEQE